MKRKKRPEVLKGTTEKIPTPCGNLYLTLNEYDDRLAELGIRIGKSGNCVRSLLELIAVLYSIILQADGIPTESCIKMFQKHCIGISCGNAVFYKTKKYSSCLDIIGKRCIDELKKEKEEEKS